MDREDGCFTSQGTNPGLHWYCARVLNSLSESTEQSVREYWTVCQRVLNSLSESAEQSVRECRGFVLQQEPQKIAYMQWGPWCSPSGVISYMQWGPWCSPSGVISYMQWGPWCSPSGVISYMQWGPWCSPSGVIFKPSECRGQMKTRILMWAINIWKCC
jgi:hypothetical protein